MFATHGVRPTYLITHTVATSATGIDLLGQWQERGDCEVGTHLHPWNTPPAGEERTPHNSFVSNLPSELQYRKLKTLHETITTNFGRAPTAYRSGRWGFSDAVAANLIRLGYAVDTSIYPAWDWSPEGGTDFTSMTHEPFVYRLDAAKGGALLEVPATSAFLQRRADIAGLVYWGIRRNVPLPSQVLRVLSRLRALNYVCLSPELNHASDMVRLVSTLRDRGTRVANMFFHSPSLLPGCSPFVSSEQDVDSFLERIGRFLAFARSAGLQPVTMSQLTAAHVGAVSTRSLSAAEALAVGTRAATVA